MVSRAQHTVTIKCGGPTRIRTWNQGIRVFRRFPSGADYLFTLRLWRMGCGTLEPVIKGAEALR